MVELLFILSVNQERVARLKLRFSCMGKIKFEPIGNIVNTLCQRQMFGLTKLRKSMNKHCNKVSALTLH